MDTPVASLLLVEDDHIIALAERRDLEKRGYVVTHVGTGEAAVEVVAAGDHSIDLILMDIDLGHGMDGTETARRILDRQDIPIVFLSSRTEPEYIHRTESITSYGFVEKNGKGIVLDTSIKMALRLHRTRKALGASEEKYRSLFETMDEEAHLWQVIPGDDGSIESWRLIDVNNIALRAWGKNKEDVVGKRAEEIWPDADPVTLFRPIVEQAFFTGKPHPWEQEFEGTNQILLMSTVPFGDHFFSIGRGIATKE